MSNTPQTRCCGKTEREHPTWPVYSDHPFGQPTPTDAELGAAWRDYYAKPENMAALNEQAAHTRVVMLRTRGAVRKFLAAHR